MYAELCALLFCALHAPGHHHAHALFLFSIQRIYSFDQSKHHSKVFDLAIECLQTLSKKSEIFVSSSLSPEQESSENITFLKFSQLLATHLVRSNDFLHESRKVFSHAMRFSHELTLVNQPLAQTSAVAAIRFNDVIASIQPKYTGEASAAGASCVSATGAAEASQTSLLSSSVPGSMHGMQQGDKEQPCATGVSVPASQCDHNRVIARALAVTDERGVLMNRATSKVSDTLPTGNALVSPAWPSRRKTIELLDGSLQGKGIKRFQGETIELSDDDSLKGSEMKRFRQERSSCASLSYKNGHGKTTSLPMVASSVSSTNPHAEISSKKVINLDALGAMNSLNDTDCLADSNYTDASLLQPTFGHVQAEGFGTSAQEIFPGDYLRFGVDLQGHVSKVSESRHGEQERESQKLTSVSILANDRKGERTHESLSNRTAMSYALPSKSLGVASLSSAGDQSVTGSAFYACNPAYLPLPLNTSKVKAPIASSTPLAEHQAVSHGGDTATTKGSSSHYAASLYPFTCENDGESSSRASNLAVQIASAEDTASRVRSDSNAVDREAPILQHAKETGENDFMSKRAVTEASSVESMLQRFFDVDNVLYPDSHDTNALRKRLISVVTSNVSGIPREGEECLSDATRLLSRKLGLRNRSKKKKTQCSKVILPLTDHLVEKDLYNAWPKVNPFLAKTASFNPASLEDESIQIAYEVEAGNEVRSGAVDLGGPTRQWVHAMSYQLLPIAMKKVQSDAYDAQGVGQAVPSLHHQGIASWQENASLGNDGKEHATHESSSASNVSKDQVHPAFFDAYFPCSESKKDKDHFEQIIATWMVLLLSHFRVESAEGGLNFLTYAVDDFHLPTHIQGWEFYVFASLSSMACMHTAYANKDICMTKAEAITFELFSMLGRLDATSAEMFLKILTRDDYFEYQSEVEEWSQDVCRGCDSLHLKMNRYLAKKIQVLLGLRSKTDEELDLAYAKQWCQHVLKVHALLEAHFNHCKLSAIEKRAGDIADIVKSDDPNRYLRAEKSFLQHVTHTLSASSLSHLVSIKPEIIGVEEVMALLMSNQEEEDQGEAWQVLVPSEILASIKSYVSCSTYQRSRFLNFCTANTYYRASAKKIRIAFYDSSETAGSLPVAHACVPSITFYKLGMFSTGDEYTLCQSEQYMQKLASAIEHSGNTFGTE